MSTPTTTPLPLRFALFACQYREPRGGWHDLRGLYATPEDALASVKHVQAREHYHEVHIVDLNRPAMVADYEIEETTGGPPTWGHGQIRQEFKVWFIENASHFWIARHFDEASEP